MKTSKPPRILPLSLLILATACGGGEEQPTPSPAGAGGALMDRANLVPYFQAEPAAPEVDNPVTPEKVALGNKLYHDKRMSKNNDISCASCHDLDEFGTDGDPTSEGTAGQLGTRNSPSSINAFRHFRQFWDGRAATVEEQALGPILNPVEHGMADAEAVVAALKDDVELQVAFSNAFPDEKPALTFENIGKAIGAFERTLVTESPFDKWLAGDDAALTGKQRQGLDLFVKTGCTTCHSGALLGGHLYNKLGLVHAWESKDLGRYEVTKEEADKYMFKVPSLLNIEKTGPYLHDGSIADLGEIVRKMAWHQTGKKIDAEQIALIVEFLKSLTGELKQS